MGARVIPEPTRVTLLREGAPNVDRVEIELPPDRGDGRVHPVVVAPSQMEEVATVVGGQVHEGEPSAPALGDALAFRENAPVEVEVLIATGTPGQAEPLPQLHEPNRAT